MILFIDLPLDSHTATVTDCCWTWHHFILSLVQSTCSHPALPVSWRTDYFFPAERYLHKFRGHRLFCILTIPSLSPLGIPSAPETRQIWGSQTTSRHEVSSCSQLGVRLLVSACVSCPALPSLVNFRTKKCLHAQRTFPRGRCGSTFSSGKELHIVETRTIGPSTCVTVFTCTWIEGSLEREKT